MEINQFQELLFAHAKECGLQDYELYYSSNKSLNINSYEETVDEFSLSESKGVSFRCIVNGKMGYSFTEKICEDEVTALVERAMESAYYIENDDTETIYDGLESYREVDSYSRELDSASVDEKINLVVGLENVAKNINEAVKHNAACKYIEFGDETVISNSKGLHVMHKQNKAVIYVVPVVKHEDANVIGLHFKIVQDLNEIDIQEIASIAVNEALSKVGAKSVKSGSYKVVIQNQAMAQLLQTYGGVFSSENTQKGLSLLVNKEGEKIASSSVTIIDNPHLKGAIQSSPFDSEGVATFPKNVVSEGVLTTLLYNLKTALKDNKKSTGNGYKSNYKSPVSVTPSNFYIQVGEKSFEQLLQNVGDGVIITELEGTHAGANPLTGDFSLAARGFLIENGLKTRPVEQITLSGNFFEVLKKIEMVGEDLEFIFPYNGYYGSPSVIVSSLSIAGE